jgi:hypothetical protein
LMKPSAAIALTINISMRIIRLAISAPFPRRRTTVSGA